MVDRYVNLQPSEKWFQDGESTLRTAGAIGFENIDMTASQEIIAQVRQQGIKCTYTHIVVRAVALVFARHPDFNRLILKRQMVYPAHVDIGVAVHTDYSVAAPFEIIINDAVQKDLVQIGEEIVTLAEQGREVGDRKRHERLNRLSRIFFASWMRRAMYRKIRSKMTFVRKMVGTFHVSSVPTLNQGLSLRFPSAANLVIARVEDRPVVRDGQVVARLMCTMSLIADHYLWDGQKIGIFMGELKKILESGELAAELPKIKASALKDELSVR